MGRLRNKLRKGGVRNAIKNAAKPIRETVEKRVDRHAERRKQLMAQKAAARKKAMEARRRAEEAAKAAADRRKERRQKLRENVAQIIKKPKNQAKGHLIRPKIKESVGQVKDHFQDKAEEVRETVKDAVVEKAEDIRDEVKERVDTVRETVTDKAEDVRDRIEDKIDTVRQMARRLEVQTWATEGPNFRFPEEGDRLLEHRKNIGIAFSGGGTRSQSLSLGYVRAFTEMGLMSQVRYIGAISGGSWFAVPYCYLPGKVSDDEFLGVSVPPSALTQERVMGPSDKDGILFGQICASEVVQPVLNEMRMSSAARKMGLKKVPFFNMRLAMDDVDEIWSRALGKIFLEDLGLAGDRYAGWRVEHVDAQIERNKGFRDRQKIDRDDFVIHEHNRPYLLVNGAMNQDMELFGDAEDDNKGSGKFNPLGLLSFEHFEMTPHYSGIHRHSTGKANLNIGGGYVENIGIDTLGPIAAGGGKMKVQTGLDHHRLSPQDIMGISGAAPAYIAHNVRRLADLYALGSRNPKLIDRRLRDNSGLANIFPRLRHWPVQFNGKPAAVERLFGDGGYVDNFGIIPLLKRKVERIVVCVNTDIDLARSVTQAMGGAPYIDNFFLTLFGHNSGETMPIGEPSSFLQAEAGFGRNLGQVFHSDDLRPTVEGLIENRHHNDRPAFHIGQYTTVENSFYGVPGDHSVKILWLYNTFNERWEDELPDDTLELFNGGEAPQKGLDKFPHIQTARNNSSKDAKPPRWMDRLRAEGPMGMVEEVLEHYDDIVDYDPTQANMMVSHAHYTAMEIEEELRDFFGV